MPVKPKPLALWQEVARLIGRRADAPAPDMPPVLPAGKRRLPGYRRFANQLLRIDMAEKLLREAHGARVAAIGKQLVLDPARAVSMALCHGDIDFPVSTGFNPATFRASLISFSHIWHAPYRTLGVLCKSLARFFFFSSSAIAACWNGCMAGRCGITPPMFMPPTDAGGLVPCVRA